MAKHNPVQSFANHVLRGLRERDARAEGLDVRVRGKAAVLGYLEDGEWVPLLRLSNPSAAVNVMNLDVRHHGRWAPTFIRGVPAAIIDELVGPLGFTWQLALLDWPEPPTDD
jgi:hypothetical protein